MQTTTLHFLFVGHERHWKTLKGCEEGETPRGRYWEVRSLPGNLVAAGGSFDEAEQTLKRTLELAFSRTGSPSGWYSHAMSALDEEDKEDYMTYGGRAFLEQKFRLESFAGGTPYEKAVFVEDCEESLT